MKNDLFGFDDVVLDEKDKKYSLKVKAPIYTPRPGGVGQYVKACYNDAKMKRLIKKIDESNVSDEEKEFLRIAATRHVVFNYEECADYYAKASKEMQELMEESALVIIDFDKAIENGYIDLNEKMRTLYELELG